MKDFDGPLAFAKHDDSRWEAEIVDAVFAMKPGELSELVTTPRGLYLLRVLEKRAAVRRPFDEVAATIRQELLKDKRAALRRELCARAASGL